MESRKILEKLISKGGLMASCAKQYIDDKEKSEQFIVECYKHCHTDLIKRHWGKRLINEIAKFVVKHGEENTREIIFYSDAKSGQTLKQ